MSRRICVILQAEHHNFGIWGGRELCDQLAWALIVFPRWETILAGRRVGLGDYPGSETISLFGRRVGLARETNGRGDTPEKGWREGRAGGRHEGWGIRGGAVFEPRTGRGDNQRGGMWRNSLLVSVEPRCYECVRAPRCSRWGSCQHHHQVRRWSCLQRRR